jgi:hypothetical protein
MPTQDHSPKTEAAASATSSRDLVPYAPPAPKPFRERVAQILSSAWFRGGCVVAALCAGGAIGFVSIDRHEARLASAHSQEMRALAAQIAQLRQAVGAESAGRKQAMARMQKGVEQMQRAVAASVLKVSHELDQANGARKAADAQTAERISRLEKQTSAMTPTATIPTAGAPAAKSQAPTPPVAHRDKESSIVPKSPPTVSRPDIPVRGYVLRGVDGRVALVETRFGLREIQLGQVLPGAGRVQSFERRSGRWVVVTSQGIIDSDRYR